MHARVSSHSALDIYWVRAVFPKPKNLCLFIDVVTFILWVGKLLWEMSSLNFSELPRIGCSKQDQSMAERLVTAAISHTEYKKKTNGKVCVEGIFHN